MQEVKNRNNNRLYLYLILIIIFFLPVILKLIDFQVVNGASNYQLSKISVVSKESLDAQRGRIFDRNGVLLAYDEPSYKLVIDNSQFSESLEKGIISKIAAYTNTPESELYDSYLSKTRDKDNKRLLFKDIVLLSSIERDEVLSIISNQKDLPGINVETNFRRKYPYGDVLAHVMGYTGEASQSDISSDPTLQKGDILGKYGIEKSYDSMLRGKNGQITINKIDGSEQVTPTVSGNDIYLSIDINLQQKLFDSMKTKLEKANLKSGGATIMDTNTGELLAMVSFPSFDPNLFTKFLKQSDYSKLLSNPNLPLINKVISYPVSPGSTFKVIVATSALEEGSITKDTVFDSTGCISIDGVNKFCEAGKVSYGNLNLEMGLAKSSNIYFCNVMLKLGIDKLNKYASIMNLSSKTDIDIPGEVTGTIASKEIKRKVDKTDWYEGDSCNTAIGQGLTRLTPIQLVDVASLVANEGYNYVPHLALEVKDSRGKSIWQYKVTNYTKTPFNQETFKDIKTGMHAVVNKGGTGYTLKGMPENFAIKTGSAEVTSNGNKSANSFSIGFWPYDAPKYAFSIFIEDGSWGYNSVEVLKNTFTK
ncbi:MAG: penicillin-binding protein 2 [bacterium]